MISRVVKGSYFTQFSFHYLITLMSLDYSTAVEGFVKNYFCFCLFNDYKDLNYMRTETSFCGIMSGSIQL